MKDSVCGTVQGRSVPLQVVQAAVQAAREAVPHLISQQQALADPSQSAKRTIPSLRADRAAFFNAAR